MTKFLFALLAITSIQLFAGCEDGNSIANTAALDHYFKANPEMRKFCKASSTDPELTGRNEETYSVIVKCSKGATRTFIYSVVLKEIEDAVCVVKKVKALAVQG